MNKLTPGQSVLVRAHHGVARCSGRLLSVNRDGAIVVNVGNGVVVTTYNKSAVLPLVQR